MDNKFKLTKVNTKKIIAYIAIFLLLYIDSSYCMTVTGTISGTIRIGILFVVAVILFIVNLNKKLNIKQLLLLLYFIFSAILCIIVNQEDIKNYIILLMALLIGYIFAISLSFDYFIKLYNKIIAFLAIFSLGTFLLSIIYPSLISKFPIIDVRYGTANVHNLFFSVCLSNNAFFRNYGLFWEPGAYQIFLNFALIFEMFFADKMNKNRICIYIITIITTFSTTGYIALIIILLAYAIRYKKIKHKVFILLPIIIFIITILFTKIMPQKYINLVFDKLTGVFSEEASLKYTTKTRINAIIYPLKEFLNSPILGVGYNRFEYVNRNYCDSVATCTPINWFALFGITWGITCVVLYIRIPIRLDISKISKMLLCMALLLIISTESLLRIAFVYTMIFYSISIRKGKN